MAILDKVARRYAKAFFEELKGKKGEKALEELEGFASLVAGHKELSLLISSPGFSKEEKLAVVTDVAEKAKLSKQSSQIVVGMARMGRIDHLAAVVSRLKVLVLENEGIQPIQVFTADAVSADDRKLIEGKFSKVLGKKVEATYETVPALIGGLRVVASGETYDGTVAGWLDSLKEKLVEGEA